MCRCDGVTEWHGLRVGYYSSIMLRSATAVDLSSCGPQSHEQHRAARLKHLDVVTQTSQQWTTKVRCKSGQHVMTGVVERLAAHCPQVVGDNCVPVPFLISTSYT